MSEGIGLTSRTASAMSSMIQFPLDLPDVEVLKTELTAAGYLLITAVRTAATIQRPPSAVAGTSPTALIREPSNSR